MKKFISAIAGLALTAAILPAAVSAQTDAGVRHDYRRAAHDWRAHDRAAAVSVSVDKHFRKLSGMVTVVGSESFQLQSKDGLNLTITVSQATKISAGYRDSYMSLSDLTIGTKVWVEANSDDTGQITATAVRVQN